MCKGNEVSMALSGRLNKVRVANAGKQAGERRVIVQDAGGERAARSCRMLWNFQRGRNIMGVGNNGKDQSMGRSRSSLLNILNSQCLEMTTWKCQVLLSDVWNSHGQAYRW